MLEGHAPLLLEALQPTSESGQTDVERRGGVHLVLSANHTQHTVSERHKRVCVRERESVCVCVCERERECVCV